MKLRLLVAFSLLVPACAVLLGVDTNAQSASQLQASTHIDAWSGRVRIRRDSHGVPNIEAKTADDALFGLGYAHAQDRLWQMEYQKRLGAGRLAEILGADGLPADRLFRTLGLRRSATLAWKTMPPAERKALEAYSAGVNAFIATHRHKLPIEFQILEVEPEPWTPIDSITWSKVVAWNLTATWDEDLMRASLLQKVGPAKTAQLMPPFLADDPVILSDGTRQARVVAPSIAAPDPRVPAIDTTAAAALIAQLRQAQERAGFEGEPLGSNGWVLAGSRTTSGRPILANDPHLASQIPSNWYIAHVSGGPLDAVGATIAGIPIIASGHNERIAWGIASVRTDVQDLFVEQLVGDDQVQTPGGPQPLTIVPETIKVKGEADVMLRVRVSPHGPLISDIVPTGGVALALRWVSLDGLDDSITSLLRMNRARNWDEFVGALRLYRAPMQSFLFADITGNIGYVAPGVLPRRAKGDGTLPVPGATGDYDWLDYLPFEELPRAFNPPQGFIAAANNRITADGEPFIGSNFAPPYRALRIVDLIESQPRLSLDDVATMQADVTSAQARAVLPRLLEIQPRDERSQRALAMLAGWDGSMRGDSPQAAIFQAWLVPLTRALFADEVGDALWNSYRGLRYMPDKAMTLAVLDPNSAWCDDVRTPAVENCQTRLGIVFADGLEAMTAAQGTDDLTRWRWDRVHLAVFPHRPFDTNPDLRPMFNRMIPNGGDQFTINVGATVSDAYEQRHVGDYRQIIDVGKWQKSRVIVAPGQSGDVFSAHYDDLLRRWQRVDYLWMSQPY
jgi:penicillin amidase